jgi:hypothetical protein
MFKVWQICILIRTDNYRTASSHFPTPARTTILIANSLFRQTSIQQVRTFITSPVALRINPDYALVHRYVASIYAIPEFYRPQRAIYHLRRTLALDPDQAGAEQLRELLKQVEASTDREPATQQEP